MCDDPNCTHGAVRKTFDRVGRFFKSWGYSNRDNTPNPTSVGELTNIGVFAGLDDFQNSIEGSSHVPSDAIKSFNFGVDISFTKNGM